MCYGNRGDAGSEGTAAVVQGFACLSRVTPCACKASPGANTHAGPAVWPRVATDHIRFLQLQVATVPHGTASLQLVVELWNSQTLAIGKEFSIMYLTDLTF